ncbi:hypothetical protein AB0C34_06895 [Nocardia sp. NPDC049220]
MPTDRNGAVSERADTQASRTAVAGSIGMLGGPRGNRWESGAVAPL